MGALSPLTEEGEPLDQNGAARDCTSLASLLADQHGDPRRFWKRLRASHTQLPVQLQTVQRWDDYLARVGNLTLPGGCSLPDGAFPQHALEPAAVMNAPH